MIKNYYFNIRWQIVNIIPVANHKILDIGCGSGATLKKLKELGKASEIHGIEINEEVVKDSDICDKIITGDIESMTLPYTEKYFDYIIFADVLEHLYDPEKTLNKCKNLLKDDGFVIATIPNIKYFTTLIKLILFDEFEYKDSGILDRTHLRFFTKKSIKKLFHDCGFRVVQVDSNIYIPIKSLDNSIYNNKTFSELCPGSSFITMQYIIKALKK